MNTAPTPNDRGQTLYDFAIGMTIFLLVVGYVFAFLPGLFSPFTPETDSSAVRADRTADFLTDDLLAETDSDAGLNDTCTEVFFGTNGTAPDDCDRFSGPVDESTVRDRAALPDTTSVNVTLVRNGSIVTDSDGEQFALGSTPEGIDGRVIRAVRIVSFDGRDHQFEVRIW